MNICSGCGVCKFHGINLHTIAEIASKCILNKAVQVCIGARAIDLSRKEIIKCFDVSEDLDNKADASAFRFLEWMRRYEEKDEILNLMNLFAFVWDLLEWWPLKARMN